MEQKWMIGWDRAGLGESCWGSEGALEGDVRER